MSLLGTSAASGINAARRGAARLTAGHDRPSSPNELRPVNPFH
jgi:hypothetical protein